MRLCWLFTWLMRFISACVNEKRRVLVAGKIRCGTANVYADYMRYVMIAVLMQVKKYEEWEISNGTFTGAREIRFS